MSPVGRRRRLLKPAYIAVLGGGFIAVDVVQPVAVLVTREGILKDQISFAGTLPLPDSSLWRNRRYGITPDRFYLEDLSSGGAVEFSVDSGMKIRVKPVPSVALDADEVKRAHPRIFTAPGSDRVVQGYGWRFSSELNGLKWSAAVSHYRDGNPRSWDLGKGSIVAHAVYGETAAVCVRRADKRPWQLDPSYEMYLVASDHNSDVGIVRVQDVDITEGCWTVAAVGAPVTDQLADYVSQTTRSALIAADYGARDIRVEVQGLERDPKIETSFVMPNLSGARFRRVDRPIDELGHVVGLEGLGIELVEDIETGILTDRLAESEPNAEDIYF